MRKTLSSILLALFLSLSAHSQENDFHAWYTLSLNKKLEKRTNLSFKTGLRLRENASIYSKRFFDLKYNRDISKRVAFSSGYRYNTNWNQRSVTSNLHRFYFDINYKNKIIKRLNYSIRSRCQLQGDDYLYKLLLRQKFLIKYNIKKTKLTPELATEYFLNTQIGVKKLRSTFTLSYPISKKIDVNLSYRIQQEFYVNNPETLFIFESRMIYNL
ncbi:MAG: DUF2490 domain-containing protein [Flavobacteriales bacterium]|nr:DUF2490 domain-containing protein [Flavobacteriales bacterium]